MSADDEASIALCRQLMEEEAMATYSAHLELVRDNAAADMSSEDQAVLHRMILEDRDLDSEELEFELL